jgi:hypothetical protein
MGETRADGTWDLKLDLDKVRDEWELESSHEGLDSIRDILLEGCWGWGWRLRLGLIIIIVLIVVTQFQF